jgi:hypothetical protein
LNQEIITYNNSQQLKSILSVETRISEIKKDMKSIEESHKQGYNSLENLIVLANECQQQTLNDRKDRNWQLLNLYNNLQ